MIKELASLKHTASSAKINYLLIPVTVFKIDKEGAEKFNKIYLWLKEQNLYQIERTASGGIKSGPHRKRPAWDVKKSKSCIEITVLMDGSAWRLQFRSELKEGMSGRKAFTLFKRILIKKGIDLESYAIDNGKEVKEQIEKPLISVKRKIFCDRTFEKVNHIDFHSSYAGGLANTHPEFREVLNELYQKRDEKKEYKNILNFSIGFMQSIQGCNARWAHLSKDAISDNNPPLLRDGVYVVGILGITLARTLLIAEEDIGVLVPIDGVVAYPTLFDHLDQFRPDGSMALLVLLLTTWLQVHLKCKSLHRI